MQVAVGPCWPPIRKDMLDTDRARELLIAERERIQRELAELVHADEGKAPESEEFDAANLAPELLQDELAGLGGGLEDETCRSRSGRAAPGGRNLRTFNPERRANPRRATRGGADGRVNRGGGARSLQAVRRAVSSTVTKDSGHWAGTTKERG